MSPSSKCPHVEVVDSLDWPSFTPTTTLLCGGDAFLDYELRRLQVRSIRHGTSSFLLDEEQQESDEEQDIEREYNLLELSKEELEGMNYYQVLEIPTHASQQVIKKAFHSACLLYHPDKTGRSEEDYVFLKIKTAFDTLSDETKRQSYDSVELTFDDSIPSGGESPEEFYAIYGPVFERNLRFDVKLRGSTKHTPPSFGNDKTTIEKVHAFYEYWIHFESWRDFSLRASQETENDVETADSRYEKRWMQKEITRKAKSLKKQEVARISLLVERSMAADPRLKREKLRLAHEKQQRMQAKQQQELVKKQEKERQQQEKAKIEAERLEQERQEKAQAKAIREREKKQLRKTRQSFRKLVLTAYETQQQDDDTIWDNLEAMNDDVELLCSKLTEVELSTLTKELSTGENGDATLTPTALKQVKQHAAQTRQGISEKEIRAQQERDQARAALDEKARLAKASRAAAPWTKQELSALAKAVKKYPAGGANRWETIALFVNNLCKPDTPRTKEECIEKYNQIAHSNAPKSTSGESSSKDASAASSSSNGTATDAWTEQQDKELQQGLKKYPGTMDKNERWTAIAKCVSGKSKKECVQRFKAIRAALKNK